MAQAPERRRLIRLPPLANRRVHDWEEGRRSTWLELFFDLVFVVAIARLGQLLLDDHSLRGILVFSGLFAVVWWTWISFAYFADLFDDDRPLDRVAQLAAMLGAIILAVVLRGGVGEDGALFAGTLAAMFLGLALMYANAGRLIPEARELCRWFAFGSFTGAALWAVSIPLPSSVQWIAWTAALLVNAAISGPIAYARVRAVPAQVSHMPERFGLFVIVVLGESILAVVQGIDVTGWSPGAVVCAIGGFVIAACVWWVYFDQLDESAIDQAIVGGRRTQLRSFLYGYGHLLVYASIVVASIAIEISAEHAAGYRGASGPVPMLGISLAVLLASFMLISWGIGRTGTRTVVLAKIALAVLGVAVTVVPLAPAAAVVVIAAAWVGLVVLEYRVGAMVPRRAPEPAA